MSTTSQTRQHTLFSDLKTIPNLLCLYRMVAITAAVLLFLAQMPLIGVAVGITGGLTDYLDGYYARKHNLVSELGATLDALTDLLFTFMALVAASVVAIWPLYLIFLWGLRDLTILGLRASAGNMHFTIPSSMLGKVASNFIYYSLVLMCLDYGFNVIHPGLVHEYIALGTKYLGLVGIHLGIAMQWFSGYHYLKKYKEGYDNHYKK